MSALINYLLTDGSLAPVEADVNIDGKVNIADVSVLINLLLKGE